MSETDGIGEAFEGGLRVAVTAAAYGAQAIQARRAQALREATARSEQETAELHSRLAAERDAAAAQYTHVHNPEWWSRADLKQISESYHAAAAWSDADPRAAQAKEHMDRELRERFGFDPRETLTPDALAQADANRQQEREQEERAKATADRVDGDVLMTQAALEDGAEVATIAAAELAYDSAERREETADKMRAENVPAQNIDTRLRADVSQGKPAHEAVTPQRAPKARKGSQQTAGGKQQQLGR